MVNQPRGKCSVAVGGKIATPVYGQNKVQKPIPDIEVPSNSQNRINIKVSTEQPIGSFHCDYHKWSGKCELCSHMKETRNVFSTHFDRNHSIAGNNVYLPASQKAKSKCFVYIEECPHPEGTF